MGGSHNEENTSTASLSPNNKCQHGVFKVGNPNTACSICSSAPIPKEELTKAEIKALKRQNKLF
jgi:hypothetical protein